MPFHAKNSRIKTLLDYIGAGLFEKDEAVRLALLSAVSGESIFFLGPPGTAKSMISRRIKEAFKGDATYFEYLMNEFSTPDEIFGPVSLTELQKDNYVRITEGYLPKANVAFLDEIWKSGPAILNTLLTIVNEKKFHNGKNAEDVPLVALLSASNELPEKDRGLEALWDRFILRVIVNPVKEDENFFKIITAKSQNDLSKPNDAQKSALLSIDELKTWNSKIDEIEIPESILGVINAVRKELSDLNKDKTDDEKYYVSDRRWKKITRILRTSAFLNGRNAVDLMDSSLIEYCVWNTEAQRDEISSENGVIAKILRQNGIDVDSDITKISGDIDEFKGKIGEEWYKKIQKDKIVTVNNEKCYECLDDRNNTWYVGVKDARYSNYRNTYDSQKNYQTHSSFSKDGDKISCYGNYTIKKIDSHEKRKFSDIAHYTLQKLFDEQYYTPIVNDIKDTIASLEKQKAENAKPFKANLFARQKYAEILLSKIDDAIKMLEDKKVSLDKERSRYFDDSLEFTLTVGDVVLKDGTIFSQSEIDEMSDEQKGNALGVVCITGEKNYLLGFDEKELAWDNLKNFREHYGDKLPDFYSKGWIIPHKENLNKIWENSTVINESLEKLNAEKLEGEYWSNTPKDDASAFYQIFGDDDDNGKQDDTTKSHEYFARAIHIVSDL